MRREVMDLDMTNIREFTLARLPDRYKAEIFKAGVCAGLAKLSFENDKVLFDTSGHTNIRNYLVKDRRAGINESVCKLLSVLRKVSESVLAASDWLVSDSDVALDPELLWLCRKDGKIKLLPGTGEGSFTERLCALAKAFPECGGETVAERIAAKHSESNLNIRALLAFLSDWELELRG